VLEAWRDGLDDIALTDHLDYRPYVADVTSGVGRAYAAAKQLRKSWARGRLRVDERTPGPGRNLVVRTTRDIQVNR
jgi:hypothetical protein